MTPATIQRLAEMERQDEAEAEAREQAEHARDRADALREAGDELRTHLRAEGLDERTVARLAAANAERIQVQGNEVRVSLPSGGRLYRTQGLPILARELAKQARHVAEFGDPVAALTTRLTQMGATDAEIAPRVSDRTVWRDEGGELHAAFGRIQQSGEIALESAASVIRDEIERARAEAALAPVVAVKRADPSFPRLL
ncbi:MAG: hypothetical protein WKG32_08395 [Gemmatimonadaceae bacterium]